MADGGRKAVVIEVSSQGLKLSRTAGIRFDYAIFTNLSPDHIGIGEQPTSRNTLTGKADCLHSAKPRFWHEGAAGWEIMRQSKPAAKKEILFGMRA